MQKFESHSSNETEKIAEQFAKELEGGEIIAFKGGLGMGKTCFVRGMAKGLDYKGDVTSPTFAIVNEYHGGRLNLYHFDMYRIENWEDLYSIGFFDYLSLGGVLAIEWSENIYSALEDNTILVEITQTGDNSRIITIKKLFEVSR